MMNRLLLTLTLVILTGLAQGADRALPSHQAVDGHIKTFMNDMLTADATAAYTGLRPYLGVPVDAYDKSAKEAGAYFAKVFEKAGTPLSAAPVKREVIGNDFYRTTWLQKFPAAAIAWTFTFYQPTKGWKLVGVSYSTDLEALYQTAE